MNLRPRGKIFCFLVVLGCLLPGLTPPAFCGQSQKVENLLNMLDSENIKTRTDAAKMISRSQLTDKTLFDSVEEKLLQGYTHNRVNTKHMDEMAWYCKALSSSGNAAYEDTLKKVADTTRSQKLRHHCNTSLEMLPVNARRRQAMKKGASQKNDLSSRENEIIAMMHSKDPVLMRNGAKMSYRHPFSNDAVYDVIKQELLNNYTLAGNRNMADALAWMCKALGASGKSKYKEALQRVADKTASQKLKKYAKQGLEML